METASGQDAEAQLTIAERELLEARSTYTVRRKAVRTILMTDPILKAVHLKAATPAEKYEVSISGLERRLINEFDRALLPLVNRRDVLALALENLTSAHDLVLKQLSNVEVENIQINRDNQELVRQLLELTKHDSSWREKLEVSQLSQLEELEVDMKGRKAHWETIKNIASAMVVASGLDWADDDMLRALVLDESDD